MTLDMNMNTTDNDTDTGMGDQNVVKKEQAGVMAMQMQMPIVYHWRIYFVEGKL